MLQPSSIFRVPLLRFFAASVFLAALGSATAETLTGEVVGLADGDTVTVLDEAKTQHKVRLADIDAPEKKQPFANRARQSLATLVFRKQVVVDWHKTDRYGRIVGKVFADNVDVGLEQVSRLLKYGISGVERCSSSIATAHSFRPARAPAR